ncbi:hypothetical protein KP509_11G098600 [Ceratopteris richardii]|uniref:Uncharacterized protein n=1 Tax=Ceratopteris richardii TaxID=49495 RepID=A0A8T2TXP4_CERRI|nr:hypothetical protein KP509_11G098600 [Ceratopteris richardii]
MEHENGGEDVPASSLPRKKRGRPKKNNQATEAGSTEYAVSQLQPRSSQGRRRRGRGSLAKVVGSIGRGRRKKHHQQRTLSSSEADATISPAIAEKPEEDGNNRDFAADVKVGQSVHGVVDGTFDAGYLVTVRVGKTDTLFRGVVFGPGLSAPLTAENDVAPKTKRIICSNDDAMDPSSDSLPDADELPPPPPETDVYRSATMAPSAPRTTSFQMPSQAPTVVSSRPLMPSINDPHRAPAASVEQTFSQGYGAVAMGQSHHPDGMRSHSSTFGAAPYRSLFMPSPSPNSGPAGFHYAPPAVNLSMNQDYAYRSAGPQGMATTFHYHPLRAEFPLPFPGAAATTAGAPAGTSMPSRLPDMQGNTLWRSGP